MEDTQTAVVQNCRTPVVLTHPNVGASGGAELMLNFIFRVEEEVGENVGEKRRGSIAPSDSKIMWF